MVKPLFCKNSGSKEKNRSAFSRSNEERFNISCTIGRGPGLPLAKGRKQSVLH